MALTLPGTKKKTDNNPAPARNRVLPKTFSFGPPGTGGDALAELVRRRDAGVLSHTEFLREVELLNRVLRGGSLPPTSFAPEAEFPGGPAQAQQAGMLPKAPVKRTKAVTGFVAEEGVGLMPKVQARPLGDGGDMPFDLGDVVKRGLLSGDINRDQALFLLSSPTGEHNLEIIARIIRNRFGTAVPRITAANAAQFITVGTPTPESSQAFIDRILQEGQGKAPQAVLGEMEGPAGRFTFDPNTFTIIDRQTGQTDQQLSQALAVFALGRAKLPRNFVGSLQMSDIMKSTRFKEVLAAIAASGVSREQITRLLQGATEEERAQALVGTGLTPEEQEAQLEAGLTEEEKETKAAANLRDLYLQSINVDPKSLSQASKDRIDVPLDFLWSRLEVDPSLEEQVMTELRKRVKRGETITAPATPIAKAVWSRLQAEGVVPTTAAGREAVTAWDASVRAHGATLPSLEGLEGLEASTDVQAAIQGVLAWTEKLVSFRAPDMTGLDDVAKGIVGETVRYIENMQAAGTTLTNTLNTILRDRLDRESALAVRGDPSADVTAKIDAEMKIADLDRKLRKEQSDAQQVANLFALMADPTRFAILSRMPEFRKWAQGLGINIAEPPPPRAMDRNTLLAAIQEIFGNERELFRRAKFEPTALQQDMRFIDLAGRFGLSPDAFLQQVRSLGSGMEPGEPTPPPETTTVR